MAQRMPVSILIVNSHPQEIKLITVGLRGFFSNCRVDVAYSAEEARVLSQTYAMEWTLIVVDDGCLLGNDQGLIEELKQQAAQASVILQSAQPDTAMAAHAMQAGADFLLSKQSPAFLAEILFCARQALEKQDLKIAVARTEARYQHLLAAIPDIFYELNADGQFVALGSNVSLLLGYAPEELVGTPYTTVFSPKDHAAAAFRFNERRSGSRTTQGIELLFRGKPSADQREKVVSAEVRARGLYDPHRRFLGTIGIIRNLTSDRAGRHAVQGSISGTTGGDMPRTVIHQFISLSEEIVRPLEALRQEAQILLDTVRSANLEDKLVGLVEQSTAAGTLRNRLVELMHTTAEQSAVGRTINDLIEDALASLAVHSAWPLTVTTDYASQLPLFSGDHVQTVECLRQLLSAVRTMLAASGRSRTLGIRTGVVGQAAEGAGPVLFALPPQSEIEIECLESETSPTEQPDRAAQPDTPDTVDWPVLYGLVSSLGGRLDFSLPATGPLRVVMRLPIIAGTPSAEAIKSVPITRRRVEEDRPLPLAHQRDEKDRRAAPRVVAALPARVTIGSAVWHGSLVNLGQGGACVTLASDFPSFDQQAVQVVLRTMVGTLELAASAVPRQAIDTARTQGTPPVRLILIFEAPSDTESSILASLIEAAREQSLSFSVDVQLTSTTGDRVSSVPYGDDRRETVRVPLVLPARLETEPAGQDRLIARVVDISRQGAYLVVNASPDRLQDSMLLHFASGKISSHSGPHESGPPDFSLPVKIIWSAPDVGASSELQPSHVAPAMHVGVGFLPLTPYAERELARLVRQHLSAPPLTRTRGETSIVSIQRQCRTARGQTIVIVDDHLGRPMASDVPVLIIAPGYGQTSRDYAGLSYFLLSQGLRVLRYDHANHLGLSDGEPQNTTLRGMQADLVKVVEFVHHTWPSARVAVLASDLSARAALKMTVQTHPLDLLMLLNPVVDVGVALMAVHGHDLIADYRYGLRRGTTNLMGLNVNIDQFVADAIAGRMTDLGSTLEDIRLLHSPLAIISGPRNEESPLPPSDLPHDFLSALSSQTRIISIPSPIAARFHADETESAAFRQILEHITVALSWHPVSTDLGPATSEGLARQLRLELEQTRLHRNVSQVNRDALGLAHLQQLPHLANVHEYRKLLDDLHVLLTPLSPETIVVDAGLGQSDMTRTILVNHSYWTKQMMQSPEQAPLLIGLGRDADHVRQARHQTVLLQRELAGGKGGGLTSIPAMKCAWMRTDWAQALPFRSQSVHRIVCNLSLSFVNSPHAALRDWIRVLHPQGRLVFTTFHFDTDLSTLYRRHLRLANQDEFGAQPQGVLHYLARLREAIRHGILHTFDHHALASLLRQCGAQPFRISSIFNGQALVAVVGKRISSSSF
ncbi:MAG: PilZ domain-containing protein [Nitrospira sp.]|nr:PilZ domain-containing protein [Nitrospira sp.]